MVTNMLFPIPHLFFAGAIAVAWLGQKRNEGREPGFAARISAAALGITLAAFGLILLLSTFGESGHGASEPDIGLAAAIVLVAGGGLLSLGALAWDRPRAAAYRRLGFGLAAAAALVPSTLSLLLIPLGLGAIAVTTSWGPPPPPARSPNH